MGKFYLLFFLLIFNYKLNSWAQVNPPQAITGNFVQVPFQQFVQIIENQTPYRFYYDTPADTLIINAEVKNKPLPEVLEAIFKHTNFKFVIDTENRVIITPGYALLLNITDTTLTKETIAINQPVPPATPTQPDKTTLKAASELKLYEIGILNSNVAKANLAGYIRDIKSGEPVIGAAVYIESPNLGTTSDQYGYYSLTLPVGRHELKIRSLGMKNTRRQIKLNGQGTFNIDLEEDVTPLKEVIIEAEKDRNIAGMQMGMEKLDIRVMKQVPTAFGETDILRIVLTLPGVKSVGEGTTGLNVRGGSTDQNLILYNTATIYNPSHLFGFFSAFNPDIIKTVELYKSAIPAKYGGRLSSVLEITSRDGNKKNFTGSGGIGLLTSRMALEGPIVKDKSSFLIAGRTTYSDWILKQLPNSVLNQSAASFYDVNAHLSHEFNRKNSLYFTGYLSKDYFKLGTDTSYHYQNKNANLRWKHVFRNDLYGVFTGSYSQYQYQVNSELNPVNASELTFNLKQSSLQADFNYYPSTLHTIDFGLSAISYRLSPGSLKPVGPASLVMPDVLENEQAVESAIYISDRFDITPRFSVYAGIRYSWYNSLGPKAQYVYTPGVPRTTQTIVDTLHHASGKSIATYHGPEYRLSAKYSLTDVASVKVSYNRTRQYVHMLSNTASISPTDVWKLSDAYIRPQMGDQVAIGYYRNFKSNTIETSVEAYYKNMHDFLDYKNGAKLILNHHLETDILNAEGKAYGTEVMIKKLTGKINGWLSYTYARSLVRANKGPVSDIINKGEYYPSNFDKPHDFTFIGNYRFSRRFSTSVNFTYSTGRPITLPLAKYYDGNSERVIYSDRNAYRIPDYYRADLALNIEGNHKVKKLAHSSWTVSVYNLTGRKNPYSVYFKAENGKIKGYQLSIFGQPIPTVTYNFKF